MLECAANSASTRTPMPFAARFVMNVRRPLWLVASAMPAASYMRSNSWHMVLAENWVPFWDWNSAGHMALSFVCFRYRASSRCSLALTNTRRALRPLVCCGDRVNSSRTLPSSSVMLAWVSAAISFARSPARKLNSTSALSRAACLRVEQWASTCLSCLSVSVLACFICAPQMSGFSAHKAIV